MSSQIFICEVIKLEYHIMGKFQNLPPELLDDHRETDRMIVEALGYVLSNTAYWFYQEWSRRMSDPDLLKKFPYRYGGKERSLIGKDENAAEIHVRAAFSILGQLVDEKRLLLEQDNVYYYPLDAVDRIFSQYNMVHGIKDTSRQGLLVN